MRTVKEAAAKIHELEERIIALENPVTPPVDDSIDELCANDNTIDSVLIDRIAALELAVKPGGLIKTLRDGGVALRLL